MTLEDLLQTLSSSGNPPIISLNGWVGGEEGSSPMHITATYTEGCETRLDMSPDRELEGGDEVPSLTAYLSPVDAVALGERLIISGRRGLEALRDGIEEAASK